MDAHSSGRMRRLRQSSAVKSKGIAAEKAPSQAGSSSKRPGRQRDKGTGSTSEVMTTVRPGDAHKEGSQTDGGVVCYRRKRRRSFSWSPAGGREQLKNVTNLLRDSSAYLTAPAEPSGSEAFDFHDADIEHASAAKTGGSKSHAGLLKGPAKEVADVPKSVSRASTLGERVTPLSKSGALSPTSSRRKLMGSGPRSRSSNPKMLPTSPQIKASPASSRRGILSPPKDYIEKQTDLFAGVDAFQLEEEDEQTSPDTSQGLASQIGSNPVQEEGM